MGSLHHAIRCSISVPSLLTPVIYKKMVLVDGGILNPLYQGLNEQRMIF